MPAIKKTFQSMIDSILLFLSNNPYTVYSQEQLVAAMKEIVTMRDEFVIETCIKALVASGRCKGRMLNGNKAEMIGHKELKAGQDSSTPKSVLPQVQTLRETIAAQKSTIKQNYDVMEKMVAALTASNKTNEELKNKVKKLEEDTSSVREIVVKHLDGTDVKVEGIAHKAFPRILTLANARENVFLYGPTGCGKSHVCKQVADALKLDFGFVSCTSGMSESQLSGRLLPVGKGGSFEYVTSDFVRVYETGGGLLVG